MKKLSKVLLAVVLAGVLALVAILTGCTQAERAEYNLTKEADNFNIVR